MDWLKAFMSGAASGRDGDHRAHRPLGASSSPRPQGLTSSSLLSTAQKTAGSGDVASPPAVTIIGTNATAFAAWPELHDAGFRVICVVPTLADGHNVVSPDGGCAGVTTPRHVLPGRDFVQLCLQTYNVPPARPSESVPTNTNIVVQHDKQAGKSAESETKTPLNADERLCAVQVCAAADYMSSSCFDETDVVLLATANLPSALLSAAPPIAPRGAAPSSAPATNAGHGTSLEQLVTRCVARGKHVVLGMPAAMLDLDALRRLADTLLGGGGYVRSPSCMLLDGLTAAAMEREVDGEAHDSLSTLRQQLGLVTSSSRTSARHGGRGLGGYERYTAMHTASPFSAAAARLTAEDDASRAAEVIVGREGASVVGRVRTLHLHLCVPRRSDALATAPASGSHFTPDDVVWAEVPTSEATSSPRADGSGVLELLGWRVVRYVLELLEWAAVPSSVMATALAHDARSGAVTRMRATLFFLHPQATRKAADGVRAEDVLTVNLFLSMEADVPLTQYAVAVGTEGTLDLPCPFFAHASSDGEEKDRPKSSSTDEARAKGVWQTLRTALRLATASGLDMGITASSAGPFGASTYLYPRHGAAMTGQRFRGGGAAMRHDSGAAGRQRFTLKDRAMLTEQLRRMWLLRAVLEKIAESMEACDVGRQRRSLQGGPAGASAQG